MIAIFSLLSVMFLLWISSRSTSWFIFLSLPGTILHELSHWVVAFVLGCKPSFPNIIPKKMGDYWILGSVTFVPGMISGGLAALAPMYLMWGFAYWWHKDVSLLSSVPEWVQGMLTGLLLYSGLPSSTDLAVALRYPVGTALLGIGLYAVI